MMKKTVLAVAIFATFPAFAGGGMMGPPPNITQETNITKNNNSTKNIDDSTNINLTNNSIKTTDLSSESKAKADSFSNSNSGSYSNAHSGDSSAGAAAQGGSVGSVALDAGDYNYKYEEASAQAAMIIASVCQDGTSVQGVKFGFSRVQQSKFCMLMTTAVFKIESAKNLQCTPEKTVLSKSGNVATSRPNNCEINQWRLFNEGNDQVNKAIAMLDDGKDGWVKQLWNKVIW